MRQTGATLLVQVDAAEQAQIRFGGPSEEAQSGTSGAVLDLKLGIKIPVESLVEVLLHFQRQSQEAALISQEGGRLPDGIPYPQVATAEESLRGDAIGSDTKRPRGAQPKSSPSSLATSSSQDASAAKDERAAAAAAQPKRRMPQARLEAFGLTESLTTGRQSPSQSPNNDFRAGEHPVSPSLAMSASSSAAVGRGSSAGAAVECAEEEGAEKTQGGRSTSASQADFYEPAFGSFEPVPEINVEVEQAEDPAALLKKAMQLLQGSGKSAEIQATELLRKARPGLEEQLGWKHKDTLVCLRLLAGCLVGQGLQAEAEPLARCALERFKEVLGHDHHDTIMCAQTLHKCLQPTNESENNKTESILRLTL